jgi:hypothetical protein
MILDYCAGALSLARSAFAGYPSTSPAIMICFNWNRLAVVVFLAACNRGPPYDVAWMAPRLVAAGYTVTPAAAPAALAVLGARPGVLNVSKCRLPIKSGKKIIWKERFGHPNNALSSRTPESNSGQKNFGASLTL